MFAGLFFWAHRQHRRPHRELPGNAAHRLEGLPAAAVLAAGNRGVCCGGSCGFPEEAGEEQEVLLRTEGEAAAPPAEKLFAVGTLRWRRW